MSSLEQSGEAWIDRQDSLKKFLNAIADAQWLVLDTEFMRIRSYYPQLCVIQLSDGKNFGLIDTRADLDLQPLIARLREPRPLALHACLQDMEALHHDFDLIPPQVFDTQIAWSFLGQDFQMGYSAVVEQQLGVTLDKSQVRSRWDRRPLSPAQLQYALSDVLYLAPLYEILRDKLEARGRTDWLRDEMQRILVPQTWTVDPDEVWRRVRGGQRLNSAQKGRLRILAACREHIARKSDRVRIYVVKDDLLLALAKNPGMKRKEFDQLVPPRFQRGLWRAMQKAKEASPTPKGSGMGREERRDLAHRVQVLAKLVRKVAADLKIAPELLASRTMIEEMIFKRGDATVMQGWRRDCVGDTLLGALDEL